MTQLSLKNRIALSYLVSTALLVLFVFVIIYNIVLYSVYSHVDNDLALEVNDHLSEIQIRNDRVFLLDPEEWREQEHNTLNVNPVFVEVCDNSEKRIDKSPNLKHHELYYHRNRQDFKPFDTKLAGKAIRQVEFAVRHKGRVAGYILIAMSLEEPRMVLKNLSQVLWISYPAILILLFLTARFIAGNSIKPIKNITNTANDITRDNLRSRIELPNKKDELYVLSRTINDLLERIENAVLREKQFTSDASHELRTPLAVVKGTLEVLIRKPREKKEYEEKIRYCISEVDRLNNLVDQLLLLARFENQKVALSRQEIELDEIILQSLERFSTVIAKQRIIIDFVFEEHFMVLSDAYLVSIIVENLLSNAIKYSPSQGTVKIVLSRDGQSVCCRIIDHGIGIPKEDLDKIFERFYRSKTISNREIKGTGLGLSIVNRLCDLLGIELNIDSPEQCGTEISIVFPS